MKEILLITTVGCEGCEIMQNSIKEALDSTKKKDITFRESNYKTLRQMEKKLYNELHLSDFPTTVFIKDGKVVRKEIGTKPAIVVLRWIDIDFK